MADALTHPAVYVLRAWEPRDDGVGDTFDKDIPDDPVFHGRINDRTFDLTDETRRGGGELISGVEVGFQRRTKRRIAMRCSGLFSGEGFFEAVDEFGGAEGVAEEHGDGHGADAAGDGGDPTGDFGDFIEVDVADGFFGDFAEGVGDFDAVDADVDDHRARFDVVGAKEVGLADGDDDDVGVAGVGGGVLGVNVAEGDRGVAFGEEEGEGAADDAGGADDGDFFAGEVEAGGVDEFDDGECGAGGDDGVAIDDVADVGGVDAFDVFEDVDLVLGFL